MKRAKHLWRVLRGRDLWVRPRLRCPRTTLGGSDYGGWTLCPTELGPESVVYSLGVGEDVSFDLALIETYGATVHAFDPTPRSIAWVEDQDLPATFVLHPWAITDQDGQATFHPPDNPAHVSHTVLQREDTTGRAICVETRSLPSVMAELGHDRIDLLKMDVEGAEYAIIDDLTRQGTDVRQLLVEFHHRFADVGVDRTRRAIDLLDRHHYRLFAVSPGGEEYSFLRHGDPG